jgi:hypothetical protein
MRLRNFVTLIMMAVCTVLSAQTYTAFNSLKRTALVVYKLDVQG